MESMSEKGRRINQQYAPIDAKINSIPCETYALDGVEYPKASVLIQVNLIKVMHHCRNMKRRGVDFKPPFTKSELEELVSKPYTESKVKQAKDLWLEYWRLDDDTYKKGDIA